MSSNSEAIQKYQRVATQSKRDDLILSHLPLVKHVIGRLVGELPPGVDVENLESAGVLGLVEAAGKFDPTRNAQFKTYAYLRIRGAIYDELRRNSPLRLFAYHLLLRLPSLRCRLALHTLSRFLSLRRCGRLGSAIGCRLSGRVSWPSTSLSVEPSSAVSTSASPSSFSIAGG